MKVTIRYEYDPCRDGKYWAYTVGERSMLGCSEESFEDAKNDLLNKIKASKCDWPAVPADEEIDVEINHD